MLCLPVPQATSTNCSKSWNVSDAPKKKRKSFLVGDKNAYKWLWSISGARLIQIWTSPAKLNINPPFLFSARVWSLNRVCAATNKRDQKLGLISTIIKSSTQPRIEWTPQKKTSKFKTCMHTPTISIQIPKYASSIYKRARHGRVLSKLDPLLRCSAQHSKLKLITIIAWRR